MVYHEEGPVLLARAGLRLTQGRRQLLEVLLRADHPLSHQELLEASGLSRVALYRALDAFRQAGLVHRIEAGDRLWRYAMCSCGHSVHCHPHFTCRVCGAVECLNEVSLPTVSLREMGYRVEEQEVYLRGICGKCSSA